jgi:hypothetical protein
LRLTGSRRRQVDEHEAEDERTDHDSAFLRAQEHKGFGDDEGEREELLEDEDDDSPLKRP